VVPNSTSKTWPEQQALLSNKEETPTARVMVYTIIGHFASTGLSVDVNLGDYRYDDIGLASARKSE